jgi:DNA-binding MarR family transcriptional regulator
MFLNDMSTIFRYSNIFVNRSSADLNITSAEHYILMYLFEKKDVSQDEIASFFAVDKGSISKTIHKLDLKNYIDKYTDTSNRRKNLICLSELGRKTFSSSRELLNEWHNTVMDGITEDEFKLFKEVLQKMTASARSVIESTKI